MSLTGVPLILLAVLVTAATCAATVLLWDRFGRWRLLSRSAGILLSETLVIATVGLVVNRADMFYPSWAALEGRTGTTAVAAPRRAGRLDRLVHGAAAVTVPWRPAGIAAWRLAGSPRVVFPTGYRQRRSVVYPAVLSLVDNQSEAAAALRAARRMTAVGVVVAPTAGSTPSALAALPADLAADVRVSALGWAVVATPRQAALAAGLFRPGQPYGALVVVGASTLPRGVRPADDVPVAVVRLGRPPHRTAPAKGPGPAKRAEPAKGAGAAKRAEPANRAAPEGRAPAVLTATGTAAWAVAENWAGTHTSPPLAAPLQLPSAAGPVLAGGRGRTGRR